MDGWVGLAVTPGKEYRLMNNLSQTALPCPEDYLKVTIHIREHPSPHACSHPQLSITSKTTAAALAAVVVKVVAEMWEMEGLPSGCFSTSKSCYGRVDVWKTSHLMPIDLPCSGISEGFF